MRHVVSFSTGLSSALAVERVLNRYGKDNVEIVAMDTKVEDEDNWRFAMDCQGRWHKKIILLSDGRTPYQVAQDHHVIPNHRIAPCTFELKIEVFRAWVLQNYGLGVFIDFRGIPVLFSRNSVTVHIGYDIFEAHRCDKTKENYMFYGWNVDFPLLWRPIEHRPYAQVVRDDWGIAPPRTYAMGFSHANCLKQLCFKAGKGDAIRFLINFPDRYRAIEDWEQMMRDHPVRKKYAILREQVNGDFRPLTLKELRLRWEAKQCQQPSLFDLDQQSTACINCGVGDMVSE